MNSMKQMVIKNQIWWNRCSAHGRGLTALTVCRLHWCIAFVIGVTLVTTIEAVPAKTDMLESAEGKLQTPPPPPPTDEIRSSPVPSKDVPTLKRVAQVPVETSHTTTKKKKVPTCVACVDNTTCNLPGCDHAASAVLKRMDPEIDPCDNFYKFSCGGFLKATKIPDDEDSVNMITIGKDKLLDQLTLSIEANIEPNESEPFRLVKTLYKICKDADSIEKHDLKTLHDLLNKLGGWPVINSGCWNDNHFDWKNVTYKFREEGMNMHYFIKFDIVSDMKNNTIRVISLDQPTLGLFREYLTKGFNNTHVQAYYKYMVDVAVIMGAKEDHAMKEMEKALLFEIQLANYSLPKEKRRNLTQMYNPITLTELTRNYPSVPWREYFTKLLPPSIDVEEDEIAIVYAPSYISDFEKLISSTPKVIQANYIMWRLVNECIIFLNEEIRERQLVFLTDLTGRSKWVTRTQECLGIVIEHLMPAVSAMYVRKYFDEEAKENVNEMVMNIRQQFTKILEQVEWMDVQTRQRALEKAAAMSSYVAYCDEFLDGDKLEKYYSNLDLSEGNYLESMLKVNRFLIEKKFINLRKPISKSDWKNQAHSVAVGAYYISRHNSIVIPAGILQGVSFSKERPRYMNYGGVGFIIGHEITHGFNDGGRQYDKDGNFINFWTPFTEQKFLERSECIIQQYGNYTAEEVGLKLNGINTLDENIADDGGVKAAYRAYNDWVARNGPEQKLSGLQNYTSNQMFWISMANIWCSKTSWKELKRQIRTGQHSPNEFRVIGPLSNMPEFAKDFNCPIGSRMNPENKCSVW